jgi:hypothetical protein
MRVVFCCPLPLNFKKSTSRSMHGYNLLQNSHCFLLSSSDTLWFYCSFVRYFSKLSDCVCHRNATHTARSLLNKSPVLLPDYLLRLWDLVESDLGNTQTWNTFHDHVIRCVSAVFTSESHFFKYVPNILSFCLYCCFQKSSLNKI